MILSGVKKAAVGLLFFFLCFARESHGSPSSSEVKLAEIEHLVVEVRSALNYQTDVLKEEIRALSQVLSEESRSSNNLIERFGDSITSVAALREETLQIRHQMTRQDTLLQTILQQQESLQDESTKLKEVLHFNGESIGKLTKRVEVAEASNSLYFDAFRSTDFKVIGNLTYNGYRGIVSETVFQPSTGVFKAPQAGLYLFLFHANTVKGDDGLLLLKHNGIVVGGMFDSDNYNHNGLGQATLLDLERNDEVWMEVLSGGVRSNDNMYVHFIGILLRAKTN
eukprot:09510.XXX_175231_177695_1 [CDS] Oithona nana genome sequencing.